MKKLFCKLMVVIVVTLCCINANAATVTIDPVYLTNDEHQTKIDSEIGRLREEQNTLHEFAEILRSRGYDDHSDEIQTAKKLYGHNHDEIVRLMVVRDAPLTVEISYDPHSPSGISAAGYNKILEGTKLANTGEALIRMERETGTNGLFAIGVAQNESGIGSACYGNNPFGILTNNRKLMRFSSWDDAYMYFGNLMNKSWYAGKSINQIGPIYCPSPAGWANRVTSFMNNQLRKIII